MHDRTIKEVLDLRTGEIIEADAFFNKSEQDVFVLRRELQDAIQGHKQPVFVCCYCKQLVKINGGILHRFKQSLHFAHLKDSSECPIKTGSRFTEEEIRRIKYNGAKESQLHIATKEQIAHLLRLKADADKTISGITVDTIYKSEQISKEWRKPDVRLFYKKVHLVFEIQLSTTFLSVIAEREHFYRSNSMFIVWVFKSFSLEAEQQRFSQKDIFYLNNNNVFVFDESAISKSGDQNTLFFHCYYKRYYLDNDLVEEQWNDAYVTLDNLTFDEKTKRCYYHDSEGEKERLESEVMMASYIKSEKERKILNQNIVFRKKQDDFKTCQKSIAKRIDHVYGPSTPLLNLFIRDLETVDHGIYQLFRSGYKTSTTDLEFLKKEYALAEARIDELAYKAYLQSVCKVLFIVKVDNRDFIKDLPSVEKVLFGILSLKRNRIIGFNYKSMVNVVHHVIDQRHSLFTIFDCAMDFYDRKEQILKLDKSGKLNEKIEKFRPSRVDRKYEYAIKAIFPEIYECPSAW
jgi:competence CoiA-like predicted nuclease